MAAPATDKQLAFLNSLVKERDFSSMSPERQAFLKTPELFPNMNKVQASEAIGLLLKCPKIEETTPEQVQQEANHTGDAVAGVVSDISGNQVDVTEPDNGYYFIVDPTDNKEKFFRVKHGSAGTRWQGYVFLDVQASDDFYPIKDRSHKLSVFAAINKDPIAAMNEYGIRLGVCGRCGRTLTDRDSRLRGIGPICAGILSAQPTQEQIELLARFKANIHTEDNPR